MKWKLYKLQFDFQKGHHINPAIVQFADQIDGMFNKNIFTQGVFIDFSAEF